MSPKLLIHYFFFFFIYLAQLFPEVDVIPVRFVADPRKTATMRTRLKSKVDLCRWDGVLLDECSKSRRKNGGCFVASRSLGVRWDVRVGSRVEETGATPGRCLASQRIR